MTEKLTEDIYIVTEEEHKLKLEEFVHRKEILMPIAAIRLAIIAGDVLVNGIHRSSGWRIKVNDQISIKMDNHLHCKLEAEDISLDILYEDEYIVVVNKPPGMLSHPSRYERGGTLLNGLIYHSLKRGEKHPRLALIHRLDRETSGVLLIAKEATAMKNLAHQFDSRFVKKTYQAIVFGVPDKLEGEILAPIGWRESLPHWHVTEENSKHAYTTYRVKTHNTQFSLVELQPHTGRTHQLRIHMEHIGNPILGDKAYGLDKNQELEKQLTFKPVRHLLHASSLKFNHPIHKQELNMVAPLPEDMKKFLELIS